MRLSACRERRESGYIAASMSSSDKSHPLTRLEARRIWLRAQRLDTSVPFGAGPAATTAAVEHLGYVQIDTINVIERSHHHVLWTRIPDYRRADLRHAQSADKSVFEYWTHALSYVPTRDIRFFIPAMKLHQREGHRWFASVTPADLRKVMRLIRRDGALTIRDIDDDVLTEKEHLWASRKPSKRALQLAFYTGALTISERNGMLKTYDLMTRHFGWDKPPKAASVRETTAYLLDRALRAQGLVSLDSICHLDAPSKAAVKRLIETRVRARELVRVALEGAGKQEHWARPETLEPAGRRGGRTGAHPLAVRSAGDPAQAHRIVLRLRPPFRGLCAEGEAPVRLFCAAGAGRRGDRRRHRSEDRPAEPQTADAEMELGRRRAQRRPQGAESQDRAGAAPLRALSARRVASE